MPFEQELGPLTESEIEGFAQELDRTTSWELDFIRQITEKRRAIFDATLNQLSKLPGAHPEGTPPLERHSFFKQYLNASDGGSVERRLLVVRASRDMSSGYLWHILVNDEQPTDNGTRLSYREYALGTARRVMSYRQQTISRSMNSPLTTNNLAGVAYLIHRGDSYDIIRGTQAPLLKPPVNWNPTQASDRFRMQDQLSWLSESLTTIQKDISAYEEGVVGVLK